MAFTRRLDRRPRRARDHERLGRKSGLAQKIRNLDAAAEIGGLEDRHEANPVVRRPARQVTHYGAYGGDGLDEAIRIPETRDDGPCAIPFRKFVGEVAFSEQERVRIRLSRST